MTFEFVYLIDFEQKAMNMQTQKIKNNDIEGNYENNSFNIRTVLFYVL